MAVFPSSNHSPGLRWPQPGPLPARCVNLGLNEGELPEIGSDRMVNRRPADTALCAVLGRLRFVTSARSDLKSIQ
jgi:hypothetical protein